jgi:hypothetical protein
MVSLTLPLKKRLPIQKGTVLSLPVTMEEGDDHVTVDFKDPKPVEYTPEQLKARAKRRANAKKKKSQKKQNKGGAEAAPTAEA